MSNAIDNANRSPLPIYLTVIYGPLGVEVIRRHPDVPAIAAYGQTLPLKVAGFEQANRELKQLELAQSELVTQGAVQARELHMATLAWRARAQIDLEGLDTESISITETKMAAVVLANARLLLDVLQGRDPGVPGADEARADLESKHSSTAAAFEALRAGRVAVQSKQGEVRALSTEVHKELVQLRKTVRAVLGPSHADSRALRIDRSRIAAEPSLETDPETDPVSTGDEAASTPPSDGGGMTSE